MVKENGEPGQFAPALLNWGVTCTVEVTGVEPVFTAVKLMLPDPEAPSPIVVLELVHE